MGVLGNYSVLHKSPGRFLSGTIASGDRYNFNKSGAFRNRFAGDQGLGMARFSAIPSGYSHPGTWAMAQISGGLASSNQISASMSETEAMLALGINIDADMSASIVETQAILALIVALIADLNASGTITDANMAIILILEAALSASGTITDAQLQVIVSFAASLSATGVLTNNITTLVNISADIGGATPLSPEGLAQAVWNSAALSYIAPGTMGEKMNNAASAGDPWGTALPAGYVEGTAGYKLGNLVTAVSGSAAISTPAIGFVLTTGIETNTYADTTSDNGTDHILDDVGNSIDGYYSFNVGPNGVPVGVTAVANLQSGNDSLVVYGWDFVTSSWQQIGTLPGTASASKATYLFPMFSSLVGSGVDQGMVRVRFSGGSSNPKLDMGALYLNYAVVPKDATFQGVALAATANSITFPLSASGLDNYYFPGLLVITSGTGVGQSRRLESYTGATRIAAVATPWVTTPDTSSGFSVLPWGSVRVSDIDPTVLTLVASYIWDYLKSNPTTPASMKEVLEKAKLSADNAFAVSS